MKKLISKAALLLATTLALPMSAHAIDWTWSWTGTGEFITDTGSGTLTTNDLLSGKYLITAMTGTWNGASITGLLAPGTYPNVSGNDNFLLDGSPQLGPSGLSFETASISSQVNLYKSLPDYAWLSSDDGYGNGTFTATQVAAVPEPETYALMLAGLAVVGAAARRRRARA